MLDPLEPASEGVAACLPANKAPCDRPLTRCSWCAPLPTPAPPVLCWEATDAARLAAAVAARLEVVGEGGGCCKGG